VATPKRRNYPRLPNFMRSLIFISLVVIEMIGLIGMLGHL
jgi:hypothetical protein